MTVFKMILVISTAIVCGCGQTTTAPYPKMQTSPSVTPTITENEVYDFMLTVIADQKIDRGNGLTLEPEPNCDLSVGDDDFLSKLLVDTTTKEIEPGASDLKNAVFTVKPGFGQLDKCLKEDDIDFMLQQKKEHQGFRWNNGRLGFNLKNNDSWYVFSIPLFSKDKTKAVMMIRNLCKGLCGMGWTVLFKKQDDKWISQTGNQWFH